MNENETVISHSITYTEQNNFYICSEIYSFKTRYMISKEIHDDENHTIYKSSLLSILEDHEKYLKNQTIRE